MGAEVEPEDSAREFEVEVGRGTRATVLDATVDTTEGLVVVVGDIVS